MVCCVKGKIVFNHATVAFQKSLSFSNVHWLFEGKVVPSALEYCLFSKWLLYAKCRFLRGSLQNCHLPFPVVFNVNNKEKASSQGFCLFSGLILRKPFSLNLHLLQENLLIPFICFG